MTRGCHIYLLPALYKNKWAIKSNLCKKILYGTERKTLDCSRTWSVSSAKGKTLHKHSLQEIFHA